MDLLKYDNNSS